MDLKCRCGSNCIKPAPEVLKNFKNFYDSCRNCKDFKLKKFIPLTSQMDLYNLNRDFGRCTCNKRHLDLVMAHILKVMMENGLRDRRSTLRNVCTPLITPAYPLNSVPYLPEGSLVIVSADLNKYCAEKIIKEVPEVKGVLKGDLMDTVGIGDFEFSPNTYNVLAGCDMRCDIVYTPWGSVCIYKYQSQIHIELPKPLSPKIRGLKKVLDKYDQPIVLDATCGPGTLGIAALLAGAGKVVFNDLWYPACEITALNLFLNGFSVELSDESSHNKTGLIASGDNFEVYCLDIRDLDAVLDEEFDVCIVDVFPGVESNEFVDAVRKLGKEVVVI